MQKIKYNGQTWLGKSFQKMGMEKETRTTREMDRINI